MVFWIKWGLKMNQIGHKMDQQSRNIETVLLTQKYLCFFCGIGVPSPHLRIFLADVDLERIPLN